MILFGLPSLSAVTAVCRWVNILFAPVPVADRHLSLDEINAAAGTNAPPAEQPDRTYGNLHRQARRDNPSCADFDRVRMNVASSRSDTSHERSSLGTLRIATTCRSNSALLAVSLPPRRTKSGRRCRSAEANHSSVVAKLEIA
jgi:hypothetical protein